MICAKCGAPNAPGDAFCGSCGAFLEFAAEEAGAGTPNAAEAGAGTAGSDAAGGAPVPDTPAWPTALQAPPPPESFAAGASAPPAATPVPPRRDHPGSARERPGGRAGRSDLPRLRARQSRRSNLLHLVRRAPGARRAPGRGAGACRDPASSSSARAGRSHRAGRRAADARAASRRPGRRRDRTGSSRRPLRGRLAAPTGAPGQPSQSAQRGRNPLPLIVGAAILFLLLAGGGAAILLGGGSGTAAPTASPPPATSGALPSPSAAVASVGDPIGGAVHGARHAPAGSTDRVDAHRRGRLVVAREPPAVGRHRR